MKDKITYSILWLYTDFDNNWKHGEFNTDIGSIKNIINMILDTYGPDLYSIRIYPLWNELYEE